MAVQQFTDLPDTDNMTQDEYDAAWNTTLQELGQFAADMEAGFLAMDLNSLSSTSATNTSITMVQKTMTVDTGKSYLPGHRINVSRTSDPAASNMVAIVISYNTGTGQLVFMPQEITGSGTYTDWTITFGVPPSLAPGSRVLLGTVEASADTSADIENAFTAYNKYIIEADDLTFSAGAVLAARIKTGGSWVTTSTYDYWHNDANTATQNQAYIDMGAGPSASANIELEMSVKNPSSTSRSKIIEFKAITTSGGTMITADSVQGAGIDASSTALQGIRIYPTTGTITGTFKLYGITG